MQACLPCLPTVFYSIPLGCLINPGGGLYSRELQVRACRYSSTIDKSHCLLACFLDLICVRKTSLPLEPAVCTAGMGRGNAFPSSRSRILASRGAVLDGGGHMVILPAGFSHMHTSHIEEEDRIMMGNQAAWRGVSLRAWYWIARAG